MSNVASTLDPQEDAFWWQGSLYRIKARAATTGGALGLIEASFYRGFGPPLHVHRREDEAFYVLEGEIRFRQGEEEFVGGPGTWVWGPRGVPHTFRVESERAGAHPRHARRHRADVRGGRRAGRAGIRPGRGGGDLGPVRVRGRRAAAGVAAPAPGWWRSGSVGASWGRLSERTRGSRTPPAATPGGVS
jgi:mannose-6-phosphate isomerase-like protein (cupin superfamily)